MCLHCSPYKQHNARKSLDLNLEHSTTEQLYSILKCLIRVVAELQRYVMEDGGIIHRTKAMAITIDGPVECL